MSVARTVHHRPPGFAVDVPAGMDELWPATPTAVFAALVELLPDDDELAPDDESRAPGRS